MKAYDIVKTARDINRISTRDVIQALCQEKFIEQFGDRLSGNDGAIIGGVGLANDTPLTIIGIEKGRTVEENIQCNFGSASPAGYRKASRLLKQANKFNRPVLTLINTPGAYAAPESEEAGIGEAIARNLLIMSELTVPTLAIILGEGGSGGAIALALADEVWMMELSVYAILSPEGFASILWKDAKRAPEAAELMKLTSKDLSELAIVDRVIKEVDNNGHSIDKTLFLSQLTRQINEKMTQLAEQPVHERLKKRQERFRKF